MTVRLSTALTGSRGSVGSVRSGVISGYVFRLIREQLGLTQQGVADRFGASVDTVAGWESGRRPLTAVPVGQMLVHRHRLLHLGAAPALLAALDKGLEADVLLASALDDTPPGRGSDPFGAWVMQRDLVELLAWPLGGTPPGFARDLPAPVRPRRGPAAAGPELSAEARIRFFDRMRHTAERARDRDHFLLRRQTLYLAGYDRRPDAADWLDDQQQHAAPGGDWLARWLTSRSLASVATRHGDRDRLARFVHDQVDDDRAETANLNYWAYWVGETDRIEVDDTFMTISRPGPRPGAKLMDHLVTRLDPGHGYTTLYVHTLWALVAARPDLLRGPAAAVLRGRLPVMLDSRGLSASVRRELEGIRYAIRLAEA